MGRMQVGRFGSRAEALDFLVAKYSTKEVPARYMLKEEEGKPARVVFFFLKEFPKTKGEVQYVGNGATLTEAIRDLYQHLGLTVDAEPGAKEA